jgi:hypothetical protein
VKTPPPTDGREDEDDKFLNTIWEISGWAAKKLPDIAHIPPENREDFCVKARGIIANAQMMAALCRDVPEMFERDRPGAARAFEEVEAATNALLAAIRKLTESEFLYLQAALRGAHRNFRDQPGWIEETPGWGIVPSMALACAQLTNKNPNRIGRRGMCKTGYFTNLSGRFGCAPTNTVASFPPTVRTMWGRGPCSGRLRNYALTLVAPYAGTISLNQCCQPRPSLTS